MTDYQEKGPFQPDYDEEGYRLEAKVIGQYILASDEVLAAALRDSLTDAIHETVKEVWSRPETSLTFQRQLATQFSESVEKTLREREQQILYQELKERMTAQWRETMTHAVRDGVAEFMSGQIVHEQLDARKGIKAVNMGRVFNEAAVSAVELSLKTSLRTRIDDALTNFLTRDRMITLFRGALQDRVTRWNAVLLAVLIPLLLVAGLFWVEQTRSHEAIKIVNERLATLTLKIEQTEPDTSSTRAEQPSAVPGSSREQEAAIEENPLLSMFREVFEEAQSSDSFLTKVSVQPATYYELFFSFLPENELIAKVDSLLSNHESRYTVFAPSHVEALKDGRRMSVYAAQTLVKAYAEDRLADPLWFQGLLRESQTPAQYLESFDCDGELGGNTRRLLKHFLEKVGEDQTVYFKKGVNSPSAESLLVAHLALRELAKS